MLLFVRVSLAVVLLASAGVALAEDRASDAGRLLPSTKGRILADRVLDYPSTTPWPDCSHLVHEVLNENGLVYPYATSNELYDGVPQFRRVRHPQPGDLIVWRGHVGMVTDTENHRFFSSTESGPRTDNYESDYWRRRGIPRFYRYVVGDQTQLVAEAPRTASPNASSDEAGGREAIADLDAPDASTENSHLPESFAIDARGSKPSKAEVGRALDDYLKASVAALDDKSPAEERQVVIVRRAEVKKVHVKTGLGWAEIRFDSQSPLVPEGGRKKMKSEKVRWSLHRNADGWQLIPSQTRVYVAEQSAAPLLGSKGDR